MTELPESRQAAIIADIEEGQRLRGWISNSYAQIEFMLGDLILRCRDFPDYADLPATLPHGAAERIKRVRRILSLPGPLAEFSGALKSLIDQFEERHETRNLLAHGFCEYLYTPNGDSGLQFQKWHRHAGHAERQDARMIRCFRIANLEMEKQKFVEVSQEGMELFHMIHTKLGWVARSD